MSSLFIGVGHILSTHVDLKDKVDCFQNICAFLYKNGRANIRLADMSSGFLCTSFDV